MPVIESVMGIQVIGNNGENIIKSPIVEAYIGSSLQDSTEVASDTPTDISTKVEQLMAAKHTHSNKAVLDKFAESDGKPTYDGKALGGGASSAEDVSYANESLEDVSNVKQALDTIAETQQQHEDDILTFGDIVDALNKKAHTHDNKSVLDLLTAADGKLQYDGSDVGLKGDKGDKGDAGAPGKDGSDGKTPVKGTDYWTAADKAEIVADTLAALPTWTGGNY